MSLRDVSEFKIGDLVRFKEYVRKMYHQEERIGIIVDIDLWYDDKFSNLNAFYVFWLDTKNVHCVVASLEKVS